MYLASKNNACWPVPQGALEQDTAGMGLFRRKRYMRAMGDIPISSFIVDPSGVVIPSDSGTKGVFIDLQNQTNRLLGFYGMAAWALKADGLIGPNTTAMVQTVAEKFFGTGYDAATASAPTIASGADYLASSFEAAARSVNAPAVSGPSSGRDGGGNGAAPPPPAVVAQNNKVPRPFSLSALLGGVDLTDPTTLAMIGAAGVVTWAVMRSKKSGGGRRRRRAGRARARRGTRRGRRRGRR